MQFLSHAEFLWFPDFLQVDLHKRLVFAGWGCCDRPQGLQQMDGIRATAPQATADLAQLVLAQTTLLTVHQKQAATTVQPVLYLAVDSPHRAMLQPIGGAKSSLSTAKPWALPERPKQTLSNSSLLPVWPSSAITRLTAPAMTSIRCLQLGSFRTLLQGAAATAVG